MACLYNKIKENSWGFLSLSCCHSVVCRAASFKGSITDVMEISFIFQKMFCKKATTETKTTVTTSILKSNLAHRSHFCPLSHCSEMSHFTQQKLKATCSFYAHTKDSFKHKRCSFHRFLTNFLYLE